MIILSADLALNHSGIVIFKDKKLLDFYTITSPKKRKSMSNDVYDLYRLGAMLKSVDDILKKYKIEYAIIEDYSFGSKSSSLYQIGGFAEGVRLNLFEREIPIRLVSPKSGKLFATGKGDSDKDRMMKAVRDNWEKIDFLKEIFPRKKKITKNDMAQVEDVCDAYALGKLLYTELMLRKGKILLQDLKEHEIMVFNKVSKKRPVNILATNFIMKEVDSK